VQFLEKNLSRDWFSLTGNMYKNEIKNVYKKININNTIRWDWIEGMGPIITNQS